MVKTIEFEISNETVKRLLKNGSQRLRTAQKKGYGFSRIVIVPDEVQFPYSHDIAISKDGKTLGIRRSSARCLLDTGDCYVAMGETTVVHFFTEEYVKTIVESTIVIEN